MRLFRALKEGLSFSTENCLQINAGQFLQNCRTHVSFITFDTQPVDVFLELKGM